MGRVKWKRRTPITRLAAHIGETLLALRRERQVTMREVGEGTGLSSAAISQIENGDSEPGASTLLKLATYFGVKVQRFFDGYGDAD